MWLYLDDHVSFRTGSIKGLTDYSFSPSFGSVFGKCIGIFRTSSTKGLCLDDPVSASSVHGVGGLWGMIAVGIFAKKVGPSTGSIAKW